MTATIPLPPTPVLETARLILRPLELRDAPAIQRIFPQWEVVKHLHEGIPWPYPDDGAETNTAMSLETRARGEKFYWVITLKGGDDMARGRIDLWPDDGQAQDMRGFWLDPALQGQGLMTEAAEAVTRYAFEVLSWPHLYLTNSVENLASGRIKAKQGATKVRTEPKAFVSGPSVRQVWILTRKTWLARQGN